MTFSIFKQIGNGSIQELILTDMDPTKNYRFKMNAQNNDGTSPWSNTVEWGAVRIDYAAYLEPFSLATARVSGVDPNVATVGGVWLAAWDGMDLDIRHWGLDWAGNFADTPIDSLTIPGSWLSGLGVDTSDADPLLSLYEVHTPIVGDAFQTFFVLKYSDLHVQAGTAPPLLISISNPGSGWHYRHLVVSPNTGHKDYIVMEDAVLLVNALAWTTCNPGASSDIWNGNAETLSYDLSYDSTIITIQTGVGIANPVPYLKNKYPLVLGTTYVATGDPVNQHLTLNTISTPWAVYQSEGPKWYPSQFSFWTNTLNNPTADWDVTQAYGLVNADFTKMFFVSPGTSTVLGTIVASTLTATPRGLGADGTLVGSVGNSTHPATYVKTNAKDWSEIFTLGKDLCIVGRSAARVESAPYTPHISPIGVVNIHKMDQTQDTGLIDCSDVGPNLLVFDPFTNRPINFNGAPFVQVGTPFNFTGRVEPLNDESLVLHASGATTVVITSPL